MVKESDMSIGLGRWPLDCRWSIHVASSIIAASLGYGSRAAARLCRQVGVALAVECRTESSV